MNTNKVNKTIQINGNPPKNSSSLIENSVFGRQLLHTKWTRVNPISISITLVAYSLITIYYLCTNGNPFKSTIAPVYWFLIISPLFAPFLFLVYFSFLFIFKRKLISFFVLSVNFPFLIILATNLIALKTYISVVAGVIFLQNFIFICFATDAKINLNRVTLRFAIKQLFKNSFKIFLSFSYYSLVGSFLLNGFIFTTILIAKKAWEFKSNNIDSLPRFAFVLVFELINFIIFIVASMLVSFSITTSMKYYGAAYFNQFSLIENDPTKRRFGASYKTKLMHKEAYYISNVSSKGAADYSTFYWANCKHVSQLLIEIGVDPGYYFKVLYSTNNDLQQSEEFIFAKSALVFVSTLIDAYVAIYGQPLKKCVSMALETFKNRPTKKKLSMFNVKAFLIYFELAISFGIGFCLAIIMHTGYYKTNQEDETSIFNNILIIAGVGTASMFTVLIPISLVNSIVVGNVLSQLVVYHEDPKRFEQTHPEAEKIIKYDNIK